MDNLNLTLISITLSVYVIFLIFWGYLGRGRSPLRILELLGAGVIFIGVVGIILLLTSPSSNAVIARNAARRNDTSVLLDALGSYISSTKDVNLSNLGEIPKCPDLKGIGTSGTLIDLTYLVSGQFVYDIPKDPLSGTEQETGYAICMTDTGRITIAALFAENDEIIISRR